MNYVKLDEAEIVKVCLEVEDIGLLYNFNLTKDLQSIELLESMLDFLKEKGDGVAISNSYFMAGVYLGEIIKKSIGGEWVYVIENKEIALKIENEFIFPQSRIKKFSSESSGDGLLLFAKDILAKFRSPS